MKATTFAAGLAVLTGSVSAQIHNLGLANTCGGFPTKLAKLSACETATAFCQAYIGSESGSCTHTSTSTVVAAAFRGRIAIPAVTVYETVTQHADAKPTHRVVKRQANKSVSNSASVPPRGSSSRTLSASVSASRSRGRPSGSPSRSVPTSSRTRSATSSASRSRGRPSGSPSRSVPVSSRTRSATSSASRSRGRPTGSVTRSAPTTHRTISASVSASRTRSRGNSRSVSAPRGSGSGSRALTTTKVLSIVDHGTTSCGIIHTANPILVSGACNVFLGKTVVEMATVTEAAVVTVTKTVIVQGSARP